MSKQTRSLNEISENSRAYFAAAAADAGNWSGTPLVGGNFRVLGDKEDRGLITDLKRAGLLTTFMSDGNAWISFTAHGMEQAKTILGIEIERWC